MEAAGPGHPTAPESPARQTIDALPRFGRPQVDFLLQTALEGAVLRRADGCVLGWNAAAEVMFGWPAAEAVGRQVSELIVPERLREVLRSRIAESAGPAAVALPGKRVEVPGLRRGGAEFAMELSVTPLSVDGELMFLALMRDISQQKDAERAKERQTGHAALLHRVTALAAEAAAFEDVLKLCLDTVCQMTGWPVGHAYLPSDKRPNELVPTAIWHCPPGAFADLRRATEATRLRPGEGLPGHILVTRQPAWVANVADEAPFKRPLALPQLGIRSVFGFPIMSGGDLLAVLEFFNDVPSEVDEDLLLTVRAAGDQVGRVLERKRAETLLREETRALATINRINTEVAGELDLERFVQAVTDAATEVTKAEFGAFFYNVAGAEGEVRTLYALSGVPRSAFETFPVPRKTDIFGPTFAGEGILRFDDVTADPRYGNNPPYYGMPPGHLPVRSHLAVPVCGRSGAVLGSLFFGHSSVGVFTPRDERIVAAIAVQAAIGIDNANLYRQAQDEIARRKEIEQHQSLLLAELNHRVKNMLAVAVGIAAQTGRTSRSVREFQHSFVARLTALSRGYNLLTARSWEATPLRDLLVEILGPHLEDDSRQLRLDGDPVTLTPKASLALSLILHELVTNAAKYGALSVSSGTIAVEWSLLATGTGPRVRLVWSEHGVPIADGVKPSGFGTKLVTASAAHELGGSVEISYRADGVRYEFEFPAADQQGSRP
jgi:PAS domain S-box-containing protein